MRCASSHSTASDTTQAFDEVTAELARKNPGVRLDLATVFATTEHAERLGELAAAVLDRGLARHVIGCTGEAIVADGREIENGPALALWAIELPDARITPIRMSADDAGLAELADALGDEKQVGRLLLTLGDPFSFPIDPFLDALNRSAAGLKIAGGMASAGNRPGVNRLVLDRQVIEEGAVALLLDRPGGFRTVVSQGCRPIGRPMIVTQASQNVIQQLGRRPALEVFRELYDALSPADQRLARQGLHIGRVINEYQEKFDRGDFLVRNVVGADPSGAITITDRARVGQTVQFHVRDAETADEDLRALLEPGPDGIAGALVFTCNGRGSRLFPAPDHDASALQARYGPIPAAGFFAMGELGPVGGQNFIHGYTASVVLFGPEGA